MVEYDQERIRKVAQAMLDGLQQQGEAFNGPGIFIGNEDNELERIGVHGRVNLWLLAQCAIDAIEPNAFVVWNEARTEGYVTFDKQVAYEARKGAESNCFDSNGTQMHLAQAFCEVTGIQNCTVQKIEIASVFDPEDFHRS